MYRCVCVELRVSHLAVGAVMEAAALGELEGAALGEAGGGGGGPAFRVLQRLAAAWMDDASKRSNM